MATQGLFGPNMGDEEMSRQLLEQRAMQFAQMPQSQRLASMGYKAGSQLGSSIAGLFGVDTTDPLVKRARRLEQLRSQVDTTTPEGLRQLAALLQQEDPDTALRAVRMAQEMEMSGAKLRSEEALAQQRGREKAAADPVQKIITSGKYTPASVAAYGRSGDIADLELVDKEDPTTVTEANGRVLLINKKTGSTITDLGAAPERGTKVTNVIPGKPTDILQIRSQLNTTLKPFRDAVNAADSAIALADDALKTGNFASAAALQRQLAKAVGETQISNQDVKSFGGDPSLIGSVADVTSRLVTGTPTADTLRKMRKVAEIVRKKNKALEDQEINQTKRLARSSGQFNENQIEDLFNLRAETGPKTRKTKSGVEYTVEGE